MGPTWTKLFLRRPLGMDFYKCAPIVIRKIQKNSVAEEIGIEIGWTLVSINGEEVSQQDFACQFAKLKHGSLRLPDKHAQLASHERLEIRSGSKDGTGRSGQKSSPTASTCAPSTRSTTRATPDSWTPARGSSGAITPVGISSSECGTGQASAQLSASSVIASLAELEAAERGESSISQPPTPTSSSTSSMSPNRMAL
eukprot:gnl/TRDRNA2_/TRDRNA2_71707_c0_seq1.p1 gnl/TRDRNA2_/TRDRNA2_71707_c0~~gnl/TRDRNA2_/TRDRNA2_71707_c0_seq1.p1  ORF type:complete len:198 (+),score=21.35 gnl/TRDRNA2_/TRDRNA2_71707_c0_seq1:166-759(+)